MLASQVFSILAILTVPALAQTAGNEQYASTSRSLLNRVTAGKRADIGPLDIAPSSITFSIGADDNVRQFLSPIGLTHKNHTLKANWGLEGFVGETLAVSVITVNGEVTCDTLGSKISSYRSVDDVWDEVSNMGRISADGLGLYASCRPPVQRIVPCGIRYCGLPQRMGR